VRAAFECEFSLAVKQPGGAFAPLDESLCFSTVGMATAAPVMDDIVAALEAQRIPVEQYYPELGHGQQELSIGHAPALEAADRQVFYRETVRAVAHRHGLWASLAPKPFVDQAGNGAHIHWSLWDAAGRRSRMYDPRGRYGVSALGYHFIAGVLEHLPALLALTCPSVNSYRRLQPHFWSSAFTAWGPDNREAAVRVPSTFPSDRAGSTNAELKASDSSSNPYLALGGLLAAGLDGVTRKLDAGEPVLLDPGALSEREREQRGIQRYPTTLDAALDRLERDPVLMSALGPTLARAYLAVKRSEAAAFGREDATFETKHHFWKF
jgi:glutamine synthetase